MRTLACIALFLLAAGVAAQEVARTSRLQGITFLGRNRPVPGATVLVRALENPTRTYITSSDEKGRFRIDNLGDGTYRVEVRRDGLQTVVKDNVALRFPFRAVVEVPMAPAKPATGTVAGTEEPSARATGTDRRLRGTVADGSGRPLPDVHLRLVDLEARTDPRELLADGAGAFEVELPAGTWALRASLVGFLAIRTDLQVDGDLELSISMVQQPVAYVPPPLELMPRERPIPPPGVRIGPPAPPAAAVSN